MNSYVWLFCIKCLGKGKTKLMEKGKCPICNNTKRKVTKPYHKSLQKIKFNVINDILFNMRYYFYFLEFISNITNLIKMEESAKSVYLSIFKEQEKQFIKTSYAYLKKYHYYMRHCDKSNDSKKKTCSLTPNDILSIIINETLIKKFFIMLLRIDTILKNANI